MKIHIRTTLRIQCDYFEVKEKRLPLKHIRSCMQIKMKFFRLYFAFHRSYIQKPFSDRLQTCFEIPNHSAYFFPVYFFYVEIAFIEMHFDIH